MKNQRKNLKKKYFDEFNEENNQDLEDNNEYIEDNNKVINIYNFIYS